MHVGAFDSGAKFREFDSHSLRGPVNSLTRLSRIFFFFVVVVVVFFCFFFFGRRFDLHPGIDHSKAN